VSWSTTNEHHLVSASHDSTVKVWDMRANVSLHTLAAHDGKALCVHWARNGRITSGGSDGKVREFRPPSEGAASAA